MVVRIDNLMVVGLGLQVIRTWKKLVHRARHRPSLLPHLQMLLRMLRAVHPLMLQPLLLLIIHAMMVATAAIQKAGNVSFQILIPMAGHASASRSTSVLLGVTHPMQAISASSRRHQQPRRPIRRLTHQHLPPAMLLHMFQAMLPAMHLLLHRRLLRHSSW